MPSHVILNLLRLSGSNRPGQPQILCCFDFRAGEFSGAVESRGIGTRVSHDVCEFRENRQVVRCALERFLARQNGWLGIVQRTMRLHLHFINMCTHSGMGPILFEVMGRLYYFRRGSLVQNRKICIELF
jgi:hypothetical protein